MNREISTSGTSITNSWREREMLCEETLDEETRSTTDPVLAEDDRVLKNLLELETSYLPSASDPSNFQPDIRPTMREILSDWMFSVCEEEGCAVDVFLLSMNYVDRFLSSCPNRIRRSQLQLLGSVCLFIASKFKDARHLSSTTLSYYTDHSVSPDEIQEWELNVLQVLNWNVSAITAVDFIDLILVRLKPPAIFDKELINIRHAQTLAALCNISKTCLVFSPSTIAAASIAEIVRMTVHSKDQQLQNDVINRQLQDIIDCDEECLLSCREQISQALWRKFSGLRNPFDKEEEADVDETREPVTPADVREIRLKTSPSPAASSSSSPPPPHPPANPS